MKTNRLYLLGAAAASLVMIASCQRSSQSQKEIISTTEAAKVAAVSGIDAKQKPHTGVCNPYAYTVKLESRTLVNGSWEWVWSVQNPNPGNGSNGSVQNLSHWGMQFGSCVAWSSVIGAAFSADGINWNSFNPTLQTDPSQECMTTPVLKFDFGTNWGNKSYYKVILNQTYDITMVPAYYKSGVNTGCCTFEFEGVGCGDDTETGPR